MRIDLTPQQADYLADLLAREIEVVQIDHERLTRAQNWQEYTEVHAMVLEVMTQDLEHAKDILHTMSIGQETP